MLSHRIVFAAMLFTVAACATATTPEAEQARADRAAKDVFADDPRRGEPVRKVCFTSQIDSFSETTRRAVIIREGRDYYLVETYPGCFDLDWAQSLAFDSFSGCLTKGDEIYASDSAFGHHGSTRHQQSCRVKAIYEWDRDAKAPGQEKSDEESEVDAVETAAVN